MYNFRKIKRIGSYQNVEYKNAEVPTPTSDKNSALANEEEQSKDNKKQSTAEAKECLKFKKQPKVNVKNGRRNQKRYRSGPQVKPRNFLQEAKISAIHASGNISAITINSRNPTKLLVSKRTLEPFARYLKKSDILTATIAKFKSPVKGKNVARESSIAKLVAERSLDEVHRFLKQMLIEVVREKTTLKEKRTFFERLKCSPIWTYFYSYQDSHNDFGKLFRKKVQLTVRVCEYRRMSSFYITQFLRTVLESHFLSINSENLEKLRDLNMFGLLKRLYMATARILPDRSFKVISFMDRVCKNPSQQTCIECIKLSLKTNSENPNFDHMDWNELPSVPLLDELQGKFRGKLSRKKSIDVVSFCKMYNIST